MANTLSERFLRSIRENMWQARFERTQGDLETMRYRVACARHCMRQYRFYRARGL